MVRVGIIGALGYGGGQLVQILLAHPHIKLTYLCSELEKPVRMADVSPSLKGILDAECEVYDADIAIERCDVLFIAQHPGWAMKYARKFIDAGLKVIDLSADFRLRNPRDYELWYKMAHESPDLIEKAVYGLPEIYRGQIAQSRLIANPGCFPTGAILALMPLLREKLIDTNTIIVDSKTGASGAGRMAHKLDFHFPELNESMKPYNVGVHRHTPEIEQELSLIAGEQVTISFTPHLIPITRGILTTAYARLLNPNMTTENLVDVYRQYYANDYFVVVLNAGEYPTTKSTFGSNFCQIGLKVDERTQRVIVISAIDNLVKGMSGEAVQNMNLMYGFDEKTALDRPSVFP
ncbi:MAG: N-acetyl-gamma-glutamyl-phosphate reductase [Armatimonadota bacterium]|nr:N-acetyl-gamma-glutamyl-phosphate reductase [Armatimonadota bacterium]